MTAARFLIAWSALSVFAGVAFGRAARSLRRRGQACHLLTTRQAADVAGVSLAAVQAWQRDGLVPTVHCPACATATVPAEALAPLRSAA